MKESNKLIAEFMGEPYYYADEERYYYADDEGMEFHTHWDDWLRPVVEEIHTHGCEVVISSNGVTTIYSDKGKVLAEEDSEGDDHMHDATYKAVVTYIKEHFNKI